MSGAEQIGIVLIPGLVGLVLFLVFTFLSRESGQSYLRAWQLGWAAYCVHYVFSASDLLGYPGFLSSFLSRLFLLLMAGCILVSTRLHEERFHLRWYEVLLAGIGLALCLWDAASHARAGFRPGVAAPWHLEVEVFIAALLVLSGIRFFRLGSSTRSAGYSLLSSALWLWAVLLALQQTHGLTSPSLETVAHFLGPLPELLVATSMAVVLYQNEQRTLQENSLAFSTLELDSKRLLSPAEVAPSMERILKRMARLLHADRAAMGVAGRWRSLLPSVQTGFSSAFTDLLQNSDVCESLSDVAYRRGGLASLRLDSELQPPREDSPALRQLRQAARADSIEELTLLSLRTREVDFGVIVCSRGAAAVISASQGRMLVGLATQFCLTLESFVATQDAQRRTAEYELLTQIGQAVSSHLNSEEVMRVIHQQLGWLFDTSTFFVAFVEGNDVRYEFEVVDGVKQPKRSRAVTNGIIEHILQTGEPLLVRTDMDGLRARLGLRALSRRAKSFCAVPIVMQNRPAGVMAALNRERELVYDERDLEVMRTAAGQVGVAMENARLFAQEQQRAYYLEFLNNVSRTAISSQDSELMLAEIVNQLHKTFQYDHIGIGIFDYATKEIEIRAEAGLMGRGMGKRIPLGTGIIGRVARSNEMALVQSHNRGTLTGILPDARSVLCIPLTYSETLLGVLNVESGSENAFPAQEILILRTLADLLASALHNAFVFQKLQQQSITDSLTGIKTRRFFTEALNTELKRALRNGRPLSVVLIDLDKFKEVNDSFGHLEGDLVLARVARLLEQKCRQSNVVARYGGDEFVVLMPETGLEQAQTLAERLRLWLSTDPMLNEHHISGSFGLGSFPLHGSTAEEVLHVADAGMYVAKHAGGDRVCAASEFAQPESDVLQRQLLASYVEGFIHREHTGPESVEELISTLGKLCAALSDDREAIMEAIYALVRAAETREMHTAGHGDFVARHAAALARRMGFSENDVKEILYAGRVHDVGKVIIPERILCKASPLSPEEYELIKLHSRCGARIVATIPNSEHICDMIEHHHERYDGSGYPAGLKGGQISLRARILGVADAYVGMTTERPFAPALTQEEAFAELSRCSGTMFDPEVVLHLLRYLCGESEVQHPQSAD